MARPLDPHRPRSTDPLVDAAWAGLLDEVSELLAQAADPNVRDERGTSPLSAATRQYHHEVMRILIAAGGDAHEVTDHGGSLLALAASHGHIDGVRVLVAAGANPNREQIDRYYTILMQAAGACSHRSGANLADRVAFVRLLIEAGADVNAATSEGATPLSATEGEDELVRLLLKAGAVVPTHRAGYEPLLIAVMGSGRLRLSRELGILRLIAAGADVNATDEDGITPLKRACDLGNHRVVAALLESGARRVGATIDTDERAFHDDAALPELHLAARSGDPQVVRMLLHDGANLAEIDRTRRTPLYWAANFGRDEVIQVLLSAGANPNAQCDRGLSPLRVAAFDGHAGCVTLLLAAGAEVDAATPGGVTALHLAALWQRSRVVPLLLHAGANPNQADAAGQSPLMWALHQRARAEKGLKRAAVVIEQLLDAGTDSSATDPRGETALFAAVRTDQPAVVRRLLAHGADANAVSPDGLTPLLVASLQPEVIEALLTGGADVNRLDPDGASPLHRMLRACQPTSPPRYRTPFERWNRKPLFDLLLAAGAEVDRADRSGTTPLMLAARLIETDVVSPLLQAGADPALRDHEGRTVLDHTALASEIPPDMPKPYQLKFMLLRAILRSLRDKDKAAGRGMRVVIRRAGMQHVRAKKQQAEREDQ